MTENCLYCYVTLPCISVVVIGGDKGGGGDGGGSDGATAADMSR